jgi:flagellar biosynthesis/type III secretory pathway protein FliH
MAILRSRAVEGQPAPIANPGVEQALREWDVRLAAAREAGRQAGIAESAQRVAAAERRAAEAEGRADERGRRQQAEFLARFEPVLGTIAGAALRLEHLEKQLVQESEAEVVRLALAVAAAVLRRSVEVDPAWMDAAVKRALAQVPDRRSVAIRMHPTDSACLAERLRELTTRIAGLERVELIEDANLPRGSCILQSQGTRLDTSLAGCWERLAAQLLDLAPASDCTVVVRPGDQADGGAAPPPAGGAK